MADLPWFESWFDEDYLRLYAHRDEREAVEAVALALEVAPELGSGLVLDLACGSGRHLAALRSRNPLAFGLDLSAALLGSAPPSLKDWLLRGDMRRLPIRPGSLQGICLWFTPFGYFNDEGNRQLLWDLSSRLRPGGVLWMDYLNPAWVRAELLPHERQLGPGWEAEIHRSIQGNRILKRIRIQASGKAPREVTESVRLYEAEELRGLAMEAGLELREALGGYDGGPFLPHSSRWIGIFVRRG